MSVARITSEEYRAKRRHGCAGTASELVKPESRELYREIGATHWVLDYDAGMTVLQPAVVVDP